MPIDTGETENMLNAVRHKSRARIPFLAVAPLTLMTAVFCLGRPSPAAASAVQAVPAGPDVVAKARAYCRRLQYASLDFVCREEITEVILNKDLPPQPIGNVSLDSYRMKTETVKHQLVYDYQYIRKGALTTEKRTLLKEDEVARNIPDSDLGTWAFHFANVLFGPATLLDERNIARYEFEVEGPAELWGEQAVVIQAKPKPSEGGQAVPSGRIWVADRDGAILKIEWDQRTLGNASVRAERAKQSRGQPRLTMTSEFGIVHKGVRFPSRHSITEAYAREDKEPEVRASLVAEYSQYQFFTVETQVDFTTSPVGR